FTYDELGVEGVTSLQTKLRSAGLPIEELPGPPPLPLGLTPLQQSQRGRRLAKAGYIGEGDEPIARDAESVALLFDTVRRSVNPRRRLRRPVTVQWRFNDADVSPWHMCIDVEAATASAGL